jgi:hypothetical protein
MTFDLPGDESADSRIGAHPLDSRCSIDYVGSWFSF